MSKRKIATSLAPEVIVEQVHGGLQVRGWDRSEALISANDEDLTLEEQDDSLRVNCQGECSIRLPQDASVRVERAHGSARIKFLKDQLDIQEVRGSLSLKDVGGVQVETVHGELSVRGVAGDLRVSQTQGNATIRYVQGNCYLDEVQGNLDLREVEGEVQAHVQGNVRLFLSILSGGEYRIRADGNAHCHIPEDASLKLNLSSEAEVIRVRLSGETQTYQQKNCELTLGDGEGSLTISTGGTLQLFTQKAAWPAGDESGFDASEGYEGFSDELSQQIAQQVETQIQAQIDEMSRQLSDQMADLSDKVGKAGLAPAETEQLMEQALRTSERETSRAQEKIRRAQEKLERRLETAQRRTTRVHDRRTRGAEWSSPSPPPPISDEESLMILRMLEQKKITPEEAEELLSALEGKQ